MRVPIAFRALLLSAPLSIVLSWHAFVYASPIQVDITGGSGAAKKAVSSAIEKSGLEIGVSDVRLRGTIDKHGRRLRIVLEVVTADGTVEKLVLHAKNERKLARAIRKKLWAKLGTSLKLATSNESVPPDTEIEDTGDISESAKGTPTWATDEPTKVAESNGEGENDLGEDDKRSPKPSPKMIEVQSSTEKVSEDSVQSSLTMTFGVGVFHRSLSFREDLFSQINGYEVPAAPVFQMQTKWFPSKELGLGNFFQHLGIGVEYEAPLGLDSTGTNDASFPTRAFAWNLSLQGRFALGGWAVGVHTGYGVRSFQVDDNAEGMRRPEIPNVEYEQLFAGASMRSPRFGPIGVSVQGGYNLILDSGAISGADWFPNSTANGGYARLGVDYSLSSVVAVYMATSVVQQGFDLGPEPGDDKIAAGAIDRYITGTLGLRYER
ncbi:MAG: hypothetical protein JKY56_01105 [Kofleriaceae bacterium]|nr:hypothetical protein [Kofleriaceae bacterium]